MPPARQPVTSDPPPIRAAEYVRMSTESQTCSPLIQREVIARYAADGGIQIVRRYADEGKSGLTLAGRDGLSTLLGDIQRGDHGFSLLLVYDVSRWGRFQDTDESAYYEFQCRKGGVLVSYCAEAFENDGTPYAAVVKSLKRIMAAEFSRDLSNKIYLAQRQWASQGFFQGGSPGYGRRRMLVDETGVIKFPLRVGDRKGLRSDRTVIVPGPPHEVATVREIFRLFLDENLSCYAIADRLNSSGMLRDEGRPWRQRTVYKILSSDKYGGANVYARSSHKLKGPSRKNPEGVCVYVPDAFQPIVDPAVVAQARAKMRGWTRNQTDDELLERLRSLWARKGRLTREVVEKDPETPSGYAYEQRFGSINRAFSLIGHPVAGRLARESLPNTWPFRVALIAQAKAALAAEGFDLGSGRSRVLTVEGQVNVSACVADHERGEELASPDLWRVRFGRHPRIDVGILGRLNPDGQTMRDWFVIPSSHIQLSRVRYLEPEAAVVAQFRVEPDAFASRLIDTVRSSLSNAMAVDCGARS